MPLTRLTTKNHHRFNTAIKTMAPASSPAPSHHQFFPWAPSPAATPPTTAPSSSITTITNNQSSSSTPVNTKLPVDFSPPLIAMVVVVATAFLVITYSRLISRYLIRLVRRWRRWRRRHRRRYLPSSNGDLDSPPPPFDSPDGFHMYSPYGLDESVIKTLPLFLYTTKNGFHKQSNSNNSKECAVCLLEFEENDYVRTLPVCYHAFHVDCIDIWLRSHANCPLCRARIFLSESPFIPVMAARIRPSLDDTILSSISFEPIIQTPPPSHASTNTTATATATVTEITPCIEEPSSRRNSNNFNNYSQSEDRFNRRDFLFKRSYSFGFERSLASERMLVMEPATASPWRDRRGSFWNKRSSPFGSLSKARVFSFRYCRGMKSPFFRRRGSGFFPLSERYPTGGGSGGGSSRRSKSMASPMFVRSSVAAFSSSRLRCGDPEALISPERYNRR